MRFRYLAGCLLTLALAVGAASPVRAHGLIGKRFFPATLAIDDPFVADELSLPTISHIKTPAARDSPAIRDTDISAEVSKRLTHDLGVSLGGGLTILDSDAPAVSSISGFQNLDVSLKYVFLRSEEHETIASVALGWEVGGTGSRNVAADSFDTVTPALFFGKGFGDLPDAIELLKPLALTGTFGVAVPTVNSTKTVTVTDMAALDITREVHPTVARWGVVVEYNIQYLQSFVRDVGLPRPFSRMVPIVELALQTPLDDRPAGHTTGTINPGIIWWGRYVQIGIETEVPINERTGKNMGILGQLHFYLDDIVPTIFSWTPFSGTLGPTLPQGY